MSPLLVQNGVVYISFGSRGDNGPWHGWVISSSSDVQSVNIPVRNGRGARSGAVSRVELPLRIEIENASRCAIACARNRCRDRNDVVDPVNKPYGRLFIATGNGSFDATPPYTNSMSYGDLRPEATRQIQANQIVGPSLVLPTT
jgi:hypothetical protein